MLAFLEPLEGSTVEKVRGMSLQYPTTQEAVYLCNGAVSEKSPQIFRPPLPAEYVTVFSGRTDAPGVRFDLTDRQTHTHTHRPNYRNPRCACAPRVNNYYPNTTLLPYLATLLPYIATLPCYLATPPCYSIVPYPATLLTYPATLVPYPTLPYYHTDYCTLLHTLLPYYPTTLPCYPAT